MRLRCLVGPPAFDARESSIPGLAATSEGVTPVSVRLSPCVSTIVRPDAFPVAWDMTAAKSSALRHAGVK